MEQLRQQCLEEKVDKHAEAVKAYSALTQSPKEWSQEVGPCTFTATHPLHAKTSVPWLPCMSYACTKAFILSGRNLES